MVGIMSHMFKSWRAVSNGKPVSKIFSHVIRYLHVVAETVIHTQYVALCTGLHVVPAIPSIPGIEHVLKPKHIISKMGQRAVFHSASYKGREQLKGRRVMILGTGETGMDLAYESAKAGAKEVVLCTRGG